MILSERVNGLREQVLADFASCRGTRLTAPGEQRALALLAAREYTRTVGIPEVERKAAFLAAFSREMPIVLRRGELLTGSQRFMAPPWREILGSDAAGAMQFHGNLGHIVVDYGRVLRWGVCGLRSEVAGMDVADPLSRGNRAAFAQALEAFSAFVGRHARAAEAAGDWELAGVCEWLTERPPCTFRQALQLVWFVHVFLHAESPSSAAISFGRLDQYLWPYLRRDLAEGILAETAAHELLCCFWLKCCEGDESQNLVVGGCDDDGRNAENPLSHLCLEVCRDLRVWQPSLSVRFGPDTSTAIRQTAAELAAMGFGMPSFLNDTVVIRSLVAAGIPLPRARDYGIVGCYEATPQGDAMPCTVAGRMLMPHLFSDYLHSAQATDYEGFEAGFLRCLEDRYLSEMLPGFQADWDQRARQTASPFESLCVTGCTDSGRCAEEGGARFSLYGVDILGLGTVVDSLHAVRKLVFSQRAVTLRELRAALASDYADGSLLLHCRSLPGKYGTDAEWTNALAARLSEFLGRLVLDHPLRAGVRPYPALFLFAADILLPSPATPDGRRASDRVSYGCGPGVFARPLGPTAVLNSAAGLRHDLFGCGNPLLLSLASADVGGCAGRGRVASLVEGYFQRGGFQVHFNTVSATALREAKAHPEAHRGLLVRVSGFSARFTDLAERWQDALIERTEAGL
jgi:formate C-acetyltransferase